MVLPPKYKVRKIQGGGRAAIFKTSGGQYLNCDLSVVRYTFFSHFYALKVWHGRGSTLKGRGGIDIGGRLRSVSRGDRRSCDKLKATLTGFSDDNSGNASSTSESAARTVDPDRSNSAAEPGAETSDAEE